MMLKQTDIFITEYTNESESKSLILPEIRAAVTGESQRDKDS